MLLIGMFDSPFVRPVAVTLKLFGIPFEHANWSVGKDFERIREFNPLGRVPTLVRDDGSALIECVAILDSLNEQAGDRALLPASGDDRRRALQIMALALGAAEKGREQIYDRVFRPSGKQHAPWVERCRMQMHGALAALEQQARQAGSGGWLIGGRMGQADVVLACAFTFLVDSVGLPPAEAPYPSLRKLVQRCEALPEFTSTRAEWSAPAA
ncbi:MAG: glutathione S-transferase family protein [Gammaproteobacteria bacterium]|nr:glutathione S-transferase family protein [Gammaproteobacteria bacterium]